MGAKAYCNVENQTDLPLRFSGAIYRDTIFCKLPAKTRTPSMLIPSRRPASCSAQVLVFRLGLPQNWDIRIGILPEGKEVLIGSLSLSVISRQCEGSAGLKARRCANRITNDDPGMIENLLELRRGFGTPVRRQIGLPPDVHRIEGAKETMVAAGGSCQFGRSSDLEYLDRLGRLIAIQSEKCAKRGQVTESD